MPSPRPSAARLCGSLLLGGALCFGAGCALRPGYVDSTTGRAYAGFAKPACYATDFAGVLGVKECDRGRDPYAPPVVAFTSFPGLQAGGRRRPPEFVTTHVHAPPPAGYAKFPGHADRLAPPPAPAPRVRNGPDELAPLAAPMPLPASTDDPFGEV